MLFWTLKLYFQELRNLLRSLERSTAKGEKKDSGMKKGKCPSEYIPLLFLFYFVCPLLYIIRKLNLAACLEALAVMSGFIKALIFQLDLYAYSLTVL